MNGHYRWCSWCCNLRYPLCCECNMCSDCCNCCPPDLPALHPLDRMPDLQSMGQPPPPVRVIRERVILPVPYPVYPRKGGSCLPSCWQEPMGMDGYDSGYRDRAQTPRFDETRRHPGRSGEPCRRLYQNAPQARNDSHQFMGSRRPPTARHQHGRGSCDPCRYRPRTPKCFAPPRKNRAGCDPCQRSGGDGRQCCPDGCVLERAHPCPWPSTCRKRIHKQGQSIIPGYRGHVPGMRFHAAGRSYGEATRDTCCIMSQWGECCPELPCRIFEQ